MTENEAIKIHIVDCEKRIERIKGFMESNCDADISECCRNVRVLEKSIKALEEIQQYRAIRTVEEFKALKEKAEPKEMDRYYCPICRHYFEDTDAYNYCPVCGQKMKSILE